MKRWLVLLLLAGCAFGQNPAASKLSADDSVRIREFYRLASQISAKVWPGFEKVPAPLLLVTQEAEFLTHHPNPPKDFTRIDNDLYVRPRQFPTGLLATFPAFGPPSVIVIGDPANTSAKTSTPWLITLMHEHFHQWQDEQPDLYSKVNALGLAHGDQTGMWMLNYAFPYEDAEVGRSYAELRDALLVAIDENDEKRFQEAARAYMVERKKFFAKLSEEDRRYLSFQLWKEGIARYVQVKCAEEAANFTPSAEYKAIGDYESFESYAKRARRETLDELKHSDLATSKRVVVYALGAAEGFLLDRMNPKWRDVYFDHLFTLSPHFQR
jgi:hypothetical protein